MSEAVERRLIELLNNPTHSPFGMPIPGLELLGLPSPEVKSCQPLSELAGGEYELCRIGEPLQLDTGFLTQLRQLGLVPGALTVLTVQSGEKLLTAASYQEGLLIDDSIGQHLFLCEQMAN